MTSPETGVRDSGPTQPASGSAPDEHDGSSLLLTAPPMAAELFSQLEEWIDDLFMSSRFFYFAGRAAGSIQR